MAFLCVCPEKSLEFGADEKLHRGAKQQFIRGVLESIKMEPRKTVLTLPGGGLAVQHCDDAPKIAVDSSTSTLAALTGEIQNYAYLVKKYLQLELHLPPNVTLEAIRERMPVSEAELLCKLYSQMGTGMISKLRGGFSFCIYDATTVRVLAGRDSSGSIPLVQGKLCDNSLFIASGDVYPGDAHEVEDIPAGCYKYGWHAGAVKFANPESETRQNAQEASSAADVALAGLFCKPTDKTLKPRRSSFDSANLSQSRKPLSRRGSMDSAKAGRRSMDSATAKTRADDHTWWRSGKESDDASPTPPTKTPKKRAKKPKAKQSTVSEKPKVRSPAEDFINKLGGAIREDSASMTMLMKLLEDSPCSLVITDAKDENLVFVNHSFEEQTGYKSEEVIGKNCRFLQAPPGGSVVQSSGSRALRRAIQEGRSCSARLINYKRNGSPVFNVCSIVPLRDSEGRITHHVGMHTFQSFVEDDMSPDSGRAKSHVVLKSRSCGDVASLVSSPSSTVRQTNGVAFSALREIV